MSKMKLSDPNRFLMTFDIFQTNCLWFEPRTLCKQPDGPAKCKEEMDCPILNRLDVIVYES